MGLFDLFKKKPAATTDNTQAEAAPQPAPPVQDKINEAPADPTSMSLEELLQKAATQPQYRDAFYQRLLQDDLVVVTHQDHSAESGQPPQEGGEVKLLTFPEGQIPVFTSTERIFDKGIVKEQLPYMATPGHHLFSMARGATFILNPYSDYGKELLPAEIDQMLSGIIGQPPKEHMTVQAGSTVQIGQPAEYPTDIVAALKELYATRPAVKAAYLGWVFFPQSQEPPHLVFAIDATDEEWPEISDDTGKTIHPFLREAEIVDVIKIERDGGISDYFLQQTTPFFERG